MLVDLAEKAQITKQSMCYSIDYSEEHGYIERFSDPSDGRAQLIRLTMKRKEMERIANTQAEWGRVVGERRMTELFETLPSLVAYIEKENDE